jgi:inhibin beta
LNASDQLRLEAIKHQILMKLGLKKKPNVTHDLPKQFILDTLKRVADLNLNSYGMMHTNYHHGPGPASPVISFADDKYYMHQHPQINLNAFGIADGDAQQQQLPEQQPDPSIYRNSSYVLNQFNSDSSLYINDHSNLSSYDRQQPTHNHHSIYQQQLNKPEHTAELKHQYHQQRYQYNNYDKDSTRTNYNSSDTNYRYSSSSREPTGDEDNEYDDFYGRTREIISFAEKGELLSYCH